MVTLYVAGKPVGTAADLDTLLPGLIAGNAKVEFRDAAGNRVGVFTPDPPGAAGGDPNIPWEPGLTREELDRRRAEPGLPLDEVKKRLGWE